ITDVGHRLGRGHREIDAHGLLVTPGFVDMHTHYDAQVTWDPYLTPSSWHGVTTVVMGNCGVGFAPVAPDKHAWLIGLMEGVEDIPGAAMHEGIQWGWESFPEYLDAIGATPHAIDFGTQIPHGALRGYVMGERGAANEAATAEDIQEMYRLVKDALNAGALGFSTSRTMLHKAIDGRHVPGTFAEKEELFGIGRALRDAGKGIFQLAADHLSVPEEIDWMSELSRNMRRPVMFNLSQTDQAPDLWRTLIRKLEEVHENGAQVFGQVAGRSIGIVMNWQLTAHPFATHPSFLKMMQCSSEEKLAAVRDPEFRARVLRESPMHIGDFETFVTTTYSKMFELGDSGVDYEPSVKTSVQAISTAQGRDPKAVAWDLMAAKDGNAMLYFPLFNYADGDLDLLYELHQHPLTRMGLSDAGAHCGAICDGGMPTFMLTHWARDRTRGPRLPLEHVIQRQTRDTAQTFGLHDRGVIAKGMKADLNLIDYDRLGFGQPEITWDLPAGGRRLIQHADGYEMTICSGQVISEHGQQTGVLPGQLIRGAKKVPTP
ncbi:MAG: amidohydrolase family protein, partial [Myxococcota bacterium]|nr:amidohydrolase family protein [Myxococcota bacterium]